MCSAYLWGVLSHPDLRGDGTNEGDKLLGFDDTDAHVPERLETWRLQRPRQEVRGIIEAKHVVVVLHVVL